MSFTSHYLTCAGREIHFTEWGSQHSATVIAWHGLARTGRDMDELAVHLSPRYRVICPDTIGRGLSQWSPDPQNEYSLAFYARIAADLLAQLKITQAHWVGTSMGGAIGMVQATTAAYPGFAERMELNGTLGTATLESGELQVLFASGQQLVMGERQGSGGGADPMAFDHAAHRTVLQDFIRAVQAGRAPAVSGRSALGVQQVIESIMESSRAGCTITLPT